MAFILPLIQVSALRPPTESAQQTYITIAANNQNNTAPALVNYQPPVNHFTVQDAILYLYITGMAVMTLLLLIKIGKLIKMTTRGNTILNDKYKLVGVESSNTAFSFFNYLFIGTKINGSDIIIRHELVHIKQKHSADIIFMEILRIINWFNPIIYLVQISLKTVHEYIADEQTAAYETDAITYSSFLVDNAYGINGSSITHSFFNYNLLKKRIIMLNQKRSGNLARLKYLLAVPVCAGMLCASTLAFSKDYALVDLAPKHDKQALAAKVLTTAQKAKPQKSNPHSPDAMADQKVPNLPPAQVEINDASKLPPPPPPAPPVSMQADTPIRTTTDAFYKYVAKTVRYPAVEHDKHIGGRVIIAFNIVDGKITDPKITRPLTPAMDGEVLRSVKAFNGSLDLKPGYYSMPLSFSLVDSKNNQVAYLPKTTAADNPTPKVDVYITPKPSIPLDEIAVVGYVND
jgi:beta-lactamase regulating signal transducer with metallopeptidase domain